MVNGTLQLHIYVLGSTVCYPELIFFVVILSAFGRYWCGTSN